MEDVTRRSPEALWGVGQSHEAGGGATLDLRLLLSGRHPWHGFSPLILTHIPQCGPTIFPILQMRKLRPGKVLHQVVAWAGLFFPLTGTAPSSCGQEEHFGEARREV